jgi:hypothetical protein
MRRGKAKRLVARDGKVVMRMGRGATKAGAGKDRARGAAAPPELAGVLRAAHARLGLWRLCRNKACRRGHRCGGDAGQCGTRSFGEAWAWLTQVATAVHAGAPPRAAARAADLAHMPKPRPRIRFGWIGWHQTWEMQVSDEYVERVRAAQAARAAERAAARTRRLAVSHGPWLRAALRR